MAEQQKTVTFIIQRQDTPDSAPYEETFEIPYRPNMNVIAALMEIQRNPVTKDGKNNTGHMGNELLGRSLRSLFNGDQRETKTILFGNG